MSTLQIKLFEEEIARRAYELWQARGCPPGDGGQDWEAAKNEILAKRSRGNVWHWWSRVRQKISGRAAAL